MVGTLPTHAFTTPCQQCSAQCYSSPFPSPATSATFSVLPCTPCTVEGMQQPDLTWGDNAVGQTLQLLPCLAHTCPYLLAQPRYTHSPAAPKWLGIGSTFCPRCPSSPSDPNSAYPGAYTLMQGACMPMWDSIPPVSSRAPAEKSPLPTASYPVLVPRTGDSRASQVFGTCCLPRLPAAAWPALLSLLAVGSSRWKVIRLTWCERDFTGVRTLDDRGEGGLKWTPSIFLMQNECRHIALISSL